MVVKAIVPTSILLAQKVCKSDLTGEIDISIRHTFFIGFNVINIC